MADTVETILDWLWDEAQDTLEGVHMVDRAEAVSRAKERLAAITPAGGVEDERAVLEAALDRMGWPEIHNFQAELRRGQDVYEDAGGYFMRAIKRLFGLPGPDEVITYKAAARAMLATSPTRDEADPQEETGR